MASKKIKDMSKMKDKDILEQEKSFGKNQGIAGKKLIEPKPTFDKVQSESIIEGPNNSFIIQGRDRPGNAYSGFGGKGATQSGRIDLIAGLGSSYRSRDGSYGPPDSETVISPNFAMDAARVYISQRADIDKYMGLAEVPNQAPPGRSTIGLKADTIRMHARNDIKIVTGKAKFGGLGRDGERLSNGGKNEPVGTISFIAGNYTEDESILSFNFLDPLSRFSNPKSKLQPIPKGASLAACLEEIVTKIQELSSLIGNNTSMIQKMDAAIMSHTHPVAVAPNPPFPPMALPPLPVPGVNLPGYLASSFVQAKVVANEAARKLQNKSLETIKINYLNENFGVYYINSKHVFTT